MPSVTLLAVCFLGGCDTIKTAFNPDGFFDTPITGVEPNTFFHGTVVIGILETYRTHKQFARYEIRPYEGSIVKVEDRKVSEKEAEQLIIPRVPSGHIESCENSPRIPSPDGKLIAYCIPNEDRLVVFDPKLGKEVDRMGARSSGGFEGFMWSPDSQSIFMLSTSREPAWWNRDLRGALADPPVPYIAFYGFLMRLNVPTSTFIGFFRKPGPYAHGVILDWKP